MVGNERGEAEGDSTLSAGEGAKETGAVFDVDPLGQGCSSFGSPVGAMVCLTFSEVSSDVVEVFGGEILFDGEVADPIGGDGEVSEGDGEFRRAARSPGFEEGVPPVERVGASVWDDVGASAAEGPSWVEDQGGRRDVSGSLG